MKNGAIRAAVLAGLMALPGAAQAGYTFESIDGGTLDLDAWHGHPVLVVNTASMCGFTGQYADLQALQDSYGDKLVVLAVPSDDFNQELADNASVKTFCEANFNLSIPMTTITPVTGAAAHPFYAWLAAQHGFTPGWNFNKVLLDAKGAYVASWGSGPKPTGAAITGKIDTLLQ